MATVLVKLRLCRATQSARSFGLSHGPHLRPAKRPPYASFSRPPWFGVIGARSLERMAGTTRLELATSAVTGQRSNQLNYVPT
jgi:hypothetical protein